MKKFLLLTTMSLLLCGSFTAAGEIIFTPQQAEAARFGGGRSFGGRPSFQRPAQQQQARQPGAQAVAAPTAQRSGFGGMMGGLLAGSVLGALFFGGAFSGVGMADIFLLLLVFFVVSRLLRGRVRQAVSSPGGRYGGAGDTAGFARNGQSGDDFWSRLRGGSEAAGEAGGASARFSLPADFNENEFITGAKLMFNRLQESWDARDLDDIAAFATPAVQREIQLQADEDPEPSVTEVMQLEAELVDYGHAGGSDTAAVLFTALLRESGEGNAHEVAEIWHFRRVRDSAETWKLDGIQQAS